MSEYYNIPQNTEQYAYPVFDPHVNGCMSVPTPVYRSGSAPNGVSQPVPNGVSQPVPNGAAQPVPNGVAQPVPMPSSSSPINASYSSGVSTNPNEPQSIFPNVPDMQQSAYMPSMPAHYQGTSPVPVPVPPPAYNSPMQGSPIPNSSGQSILNNPDAQYFQNSPTELSAYPTIQRPKGNPIFISLDTNNDDVKTQNALLGVGIGAAAAILTGGLLVPVIAGVVGYNLIKKERRSKFCVFPNTFVWELRSAIGDLLKVNPELILMERKDMIMDDNEMMQKYVKGSKTKATLKISIHSTPVAGSNYYSPNGSVYPKAHHVSLVKK